MSQDLSEVFGSPAAASLRGLLPRRGDGTAVPEPETTRPNHLTAVPAVARDEAPAAVEVPAAADVPAPRTPLRSDRPAAPTGNGSAADGTTTSATAGDRTTTSRASGSRARTSRTTTTGGTTTGGTTGTRSTANRRWGVARVACRDHVDLLVLLALRHGPADGRGVITRLRERSGGQLDAPERTIHATLHRLARNRLLARRPDHGSGRHLYGLTAAGERAARSRLREWHALTRAVDAVAGTDPVDGPDARS